MTETLRFDDKEFRVAMKTNYKSSKHLKEN